MGLAIRKPFHEVTRDEWNAVREVQLVGVFEATQSFTKRMAVGWVINVSSFTTVGVMSELIRYIAVKEGMDALMCGAAKEPAPDIWVNAVSSG